MKRILWHGSEKIIIKPEYGRGKAYNDYGKGFYCTEQKSIAKEWSVKKDRDGFINCYQIDDAGLDILNLNDPDYTILHWISILVENRTFEINSSLGVEAVDYLSENFSLPYKKRDVIIGYRADDSYFSFAKDFLNGAISLRQLNIAMRLGKLGEQYVIKSRKAFSALSFMNYEKVDHHEWFIKKQARDKNARTQYFDDLKVKRRKGDIYILNILDEKMRADDERLRQNLS